MKIKFIICFIWIFNAHSLFANEKIFNVKDFGAISNDKKDDSEAIQKCINEAVKYPNSKILFESGVYIINKTLQLDYTRSILTLCGAIVGNSLTELHSTSEKNIIGVKGFYSNPSTGTFNILNIKIIGNNTPYSTKHTKANKPHWNAAIGITDMKNVNINNIIIENFYGQGIYIASTVVNADNDDRFSNVEITNSKILNVWGFHPKGDDYGDAIYLANVSNGLIKNNYIKNQINKTKQLGRSGIVLEYFTENIKLVNNQIIEGYDRPLHIENTLGGHIIENNIFQGSDLGVVIVENLNKSYKPTIITNNKITNTNLWKDIKVTKSYGEGNFGDRSLVYILTNNIENLSLIFLKSNKITIDKNFIYNSNSVMNIRSKNVSISENIIHSTNKNSKYSIFNYGKSKFISNKLSENFDVK